MMNNHVVKKNSIIDFFKIFHVLFNDPYLPFLAKMNSSDFTRNRKLTLDKLLSLLVFRHGKTLNQDVVQFYNTIAIPEATVTKQALSLALRKVKPQVFEHLFHQFSSHFYHSDLVKYYRGYILLAEDGTSLQAPLTDESMDVFGFHTNQYVKEKSDVKMVNAKMGGLFDITNGFFVSSTVDKGDTSEIPLAFSNLEKAINCINDKKVIYLTDRYYGSVELFQFLTMKSFNYCIRAKSNYFKEEVASIKEDDWIDIEIDKAWLKRLKRQDVIQYTTDNPIVRIRVVKHILEHPNSNGETEHIYFTNLSEDEFSKEEVADLYRFRWDIETHYKFLKVDLEAERFNTTSPYVFLCKCYAKLLMLNMAGIIISEVNMVLSEKKTLKHQKGFKTKFCNVKDHIHESKLVYAIIYNDTAVLNKTITTIIDNSTKMIVPIRENRHYQRYGRFMFSATSYRFKIDGRNHPKVRKTKYGLVTTPH